MDYVRAATKAGCEVTFHRDTGACSVFYRGEEDDDTSYGYGATLFEALADMAPGVGEQAPAKAPPPARLPCAYCGLTHTTGMHDVGEQMPP